jgi:hypothetical protein
VRNHVLLEVPVSNISLLINHLFRLR